MTQSELCLVPELATLVALDATLQATMTLLEFNYPGRPESENRDTEDGIEEHIIDSIFNLAKALRSTLTAYYAAVQENCDCGPNQKDIPF